jgi:hypothetical protein
LRQREQVRQKRAHGAVAVASRLAGAAPDAVLSCCSVPTGLVLAASAARASAVCREVGCGWLRAVLAAPALAMVAMKNW